MTLRQALFDELRPLHDKVDSHFSAMDLTDADGFAAFLTAQHLGMEGLYRAAVHSPTCRVTAELDDLLSRIGSDLACLGHPAPRSEAQTGAPMHPLAIEYIFLGSRLGNKVLKRQWQVARDDRVCAASQMFTAPDPAMNWREFCAELYRINATSGLARKVIDDAARAFAMFLGRGESVRPFDTCHLKDLS